ARPTGDRGLGGIARWMVGARGGGTGTVRAVEDERAGGSPGGSGEGEARGAGPGRDPPLGRPPGDPPREAPAPATGAAADWRVDACLSSLTSLAPSSVAAYARDIRSFVTWAQRAGSAGPSAVDRTTVRRYLAYLTTRRYARRSIARRASALRRYFRWLHRTGAIGHDPTTGLSAPKGEARLPRVLRPDELRALLDDVPPAVR